MESASHIRPLLEWLLDLERIRLGRDAPLSLHWEPAIPVWLLLPLGVMAAYVVAAAYRRERGAMGRRYLLGSTRVALIGLILAMLCQPSLRLQRNRTERSYVALLVDDSQSMLVRDFGGASESRIDSVRGALLAADAATIRSMMTRNRLELFSFGGDVRREATADDADDIALIVDALARQRCVASVTDVPGAVEAILGRRVSGRLAAVVLASDGRSTEPGTIDAAVSTARALKVPVFPILVGSDAPRCDVAVGQVTTAGSVFLEDLVAIRARVEASGIDGVTDVTVRLLDVGSETILATEHVSLSSSAVAPEIEFTFKPQRIGRMEVRVEAEAVDGESVLSNNSAAVRVNVMNDKLKVLYVEGYPRYEYRYLKNMLLREPTIDSSCLLLSADPGFAQEGTAPVRHFPSDAEELSEFDVVLFGDVDPTGDWLSPSQAEMLVDFVAEGGGGFGLLCGPRFAPHRFAGTSLEKLLPVRIDPGFLGMYTSALQNSFQPRLTTEGTQSHVFRFSGADDPAAYLAGLYWIARTLGPKPGAEVLAVHPEMTSASDPSMAVDAALMPLVVRGRYGAGRVLICTTDDTWRWRRGDSEWVFDSFWLQVCRSLVSPKDVGTDGRVDLRTDRSRYPYGQRVQIRAVVSDWALLASLGDAIEVLIVNDANRPSRRVRMTRVGDESGVFEGAFVPSGAGGYRIALERVTPLPGTRGATAGFRVSQADLELRRPQADHAVLRRLAAETGGAVTSLEGIAEAVGSIEDRSIQIPDDVSEPLWDSKLAIGLFIVLLVMEWVLRKSFGMV